MTTIKNALVSVSDKAGLESLAKYLIENKVRTLSTGGTYKKLKELGVPVIKVSEQTDFPEVMNGRVKTLHPKIHMGLLARKDHSGDKEILAEHGMEVFDLLVVNLYPFQKKQEEALPEEEMVEFIDVGGPSMIRAGAKNYNRLLTLTDPQDYEVLNSKDLDISIRKKMAAKAFRHLSDYDNSVSNWLSGYTEKKLRYGENPHQEASWIASEDSGLHQAEILQGKELSFNNIVDLSAAVETLSQFEGITVVSVKHNNPCGIATAGTIEKAVEMSLAGDPQSVFGGIVASNVEIDEKAALKLSSLFLECIIAPSVSKEARVIFQKKKNLRILTWPKLLQGFSPAKDYKRVAGGIVKQTSDQTISLDTSLWRNVSGEEPSTEILNALKFAWRSSARLKSNAIAITSLNQTLGLGMGQVNRVDAVQIAVDRWKRFHSEYEGPVVLASDAFFPFADSIELAHKAGVNWVIQPGGSIKDQEVIDKANELGVNMVFTGSRHFLH